jgi:hypothetical protein
MMPALVADISLDRTAQLSAFVKLKLMDCAISPGWETTPGFV